MLWLYNNSDTSNFYQIFANSTIVHNSDDSTIYSFESTSNNINIDEKNSLQDKTQLISYTVRILDNLISYKNIHTGESVTFSFKLNFMKPTKKHNYPIFNFSYKKVSNSKMPNIASSEYNTCIDVQLQIHKIECDVQYIIETNLNTGTIRKYWIVSDINLFDKHMR